MTTHFSACRKRSRAAFAPARVVSTIGIVVGLLLLAPTNAAAAGPVDDAPGAPVSSAASSEAGSFPRTGESGQSARDELPGGWSAWVDQIAPYRTKIRAAIAVGVAAVLALLARGQSKKARWRAAVKKGRLTARQERFLDAPAIPPVVHHTAAEVEAAVQAAVEPGKPEPVPVGQRPADAPSPDETGDVRAAGDVAGDAAPGQRPTILCIDDDPEVSRSLAVRLRPYGVDVLRAFSGMQGFWMALNSRPDVIITDLKMPDGQGDYVFSRLKNHSLTKDTPIIVLTGYANPGHKREMLSAGVTNYFTKPWDFDELLRELRSHIDLPSSPLDLDAAVHSA
ncbi:MAG: response regulator [Pirellulales bacterium]|nr:response regulator [Pirellulales bacterium]